ncbi:MAG: single-stranded-DNA-specific exonuclease RecJ [Bacteroidetes bacterium]|nr:single-stranded-DNA-specific exonuclease RecJ [Bacteroidota bacterium]
MNPSNLKNFKWDKLPEPDKSKISTLASEINTSKLIAQLLLQRGVSNYEAARKYFAPQILDLHDPFLMKDMEKAVNRIIEAKSKNEHCFIFGDYDVDGTNGTALLYLFLKNIGVNVSYYIPDRIKEGYGISILGIDEAKNKSTKLIIAVDCGINEVENVNYAKSFDIDFIICDHHEVGEVLPNAVAVLDPLQNDCNYPFKYLCGCGVAFKLIQAINLKLNLKIDLLPYLDFVAVAIGADIVPIIDENRILMQLGIDHLKISPNLGYKKLMIAANINQQKLTNWNIVFGLAPRINAVGRLGKATRAVELFISDSEVNADELSNEMNKENTLRKNIQEQTVSEAIEMYETNPNLKNGNVILLYNDSWHPGVIGIVASKLVETYYLPTIILTKVDKIAKGSCRSISDVNIYDALHNFNNLILNFGGHVVAAGLSIEIEKINILRDELSNYFKNILTDDIRIPKIKVDAVVKLDEIDNTFLKSIFRFAPYGPQNMAPTFVSKNIRFNENVKLQKNNTFKATLNINDRLIDCISFNNLEMFEMAKTKKYFDILFEFNENDYNGRVTPQIKLKQIKFSENN